MENSSCPLVFIYIHPCFPAKAQKCVLCCTTAVNKAGLNPDFIFDLFFTCSTTPLCWWDGKFSLTFTQATHLSLKCCYDASVTGFQTPVTSEHSSRWQLFISVDFEVFYHPSGSLVSWGRKEMCLTSDCLSMVPYSSDFQPRIFVPQGYALDSGCVDG